MIIIIIIVIMVTVRWMYKYILVHTVHLMMTRSYVRPGTTFFSLF